MLLIIDFGAFFATNKGQQHQLRGFVGENTIEWEGSHVTKRE